MRRLHTSARLREFVVRCVRRHLPLGFMVHRTPLSLRQIDRYLRATAPSEVEIIVLSVGRPPGHARPAHLPPRPSTATWCWRGRSWTCTSGSPTGPPGARSLTGDELAAALGRDPGPWLAPLLDALREGQVVGVLRTRDQAIRFARAWRG